MNVSELSTTVAEIDNLLADLDEIEFKWAGGNGSVTQGAFQEHLDRWVGLVVECIRQRVSDREAGEARRKLASIWYTWGSPDDPEAVQFGSDLPSARAYLDALKGAIAKYPHLLQSAEAVTPPSAEAIAPSRIEVPAPQPLTLAQTHALAVLERHRYLVRIFDVVVNALAFFVESVISWVVSFLYLFRVLGWVLLWLWRRFPMSAWRWTRDEKNVARWIVVGVLLTAIGVIVAIVALVRDSPKGNP